ncbi:MAG: hypothetical protein EXQ96_11075 [Alphaproteobacteria bacterium]|nr:hypothetical protein [Alphaproteobacteria bacterium]
MPIKSVLAYLGHAEAEQAAVETAIEVARRFQGHVRGFHVRPDPREAAVFMAEGLSGSMLAEVIEAPPSATASATATPPTGASRRRSARREYRLATRLRSRPAQPRAGARPSVTTRPSSRVKAACTI